MTDGVCHDFSTHYSGRTHQYYTSYLLRFSNRPRRILDLGCGLGLFLECCREYEIEGVGLEYSDEALEACQAKGLDVIKHDLAKPFPLESESFDAVFSFQVIEHLTRPAQVNMLQEAWRVLRPNGQAQIDSPCRFFYQAQLAPTHIGLLSPRELREMAEKAGFKRVNMGYNFPQEFDDLPKEIVKELWKTYHPDILSQTATILAYKE